MSEDRDYWQHHFGSETGAHRALADTARMRGLDALRPDPLEDTQRMNAAERANARNHGAALHASRELPRERRKPSTVGERQRLASSDPDGHRQAIVDFISEGSKHV